MKDLRLIIWHDNSPMNPWEDWDCEPPVMFQGGRHGMLNDYSEGSIVDFIKEKATRGMVLRHQVTIAEILEQNLEYFKDFTADEKVDELMYETRNASIEQLGKLCELFKIPYKQYTSRGYSQGDWADVLIVLTDEFFERTGCDRKNSESILEGTAELFNNWCWGDVYGFTVERKVEYVKLTREDFNNGKFEEVEDEVEWEFEDSCGGFFGSNFETNGMMEHLPEELHEQLKNYNYQDIKY